MKLKFLNEFKNVKTVLSVLLFMLIITGCKDISQLIVNQQDDLLNIFRTEENDFEFRIKCNFNYKNFNKEDKTTYTWWVDLIKIEKINADQEDNKIVFKCLQNDKMNELCILKSFHLKREPVPAGLISSGGGESVSLSLDSFDLMKVNDPVKLNELVKSFVILKEFCQQEDESIVTTLVSSIKTTFRSIGSFFHNLLMDIITVLTMLLS